MKPLPAAPFALARRVVLVALGLWGALAAPAAAQTLPQLGASAETAEDSESAPTPAERLAAATAELEAARARQTNAAASASEALAEEVALLERIEGAINQVIATDELIDAEREAGRDLDKQLEILEREGPNHEQPYGFLLLETLRDRRNDEQQRFERLQEAVELSTAARAKARGSMEDKQAARRQAREAVESQSKPTPVALRAARRAALEAQLAEEQLVLRTLELEQDEAELANQRLRRDLAKSEFDQVAEGDPVLTTEDRERIRTELSVRVERTKADLQVAGRSRDYARERWGDARDRADAAGSNNPLLQAEVEAAAEELDRRQTELEAIEQRLEGLGALNTLWDHRMAVFEGTAEEEEIRVWCDEAAAELEELGTRERTKINLMSDARAELVTLDAEIEAASDAQLITALRKQRTAIAAVVAVYEDQLAFLEEQQRLYRKLIDDAGLSDEGLDITFFFGTLWDKLVYVWKWEVFHVGENSITVRKIALGLTILLVGVFLSKRLTSFLCDRILPNFGLNEGVRHAIESLLLYLMVITFALIALRVVNIPLTAFTILGGALAIGVGFGSQNIVNNFISGLILLTEQPVRVADLIQIGELYGTVQHIGLRSTRIRTGDNIELIVPNSSFLEQNVVNWTLTDTKTRISVAVGVAYGSPTRKVKDLLKRAATEHGLVLDKPEPLVLFTNFGESSLDFEVHFWIHMKKLMDRSQLQSDIRFRIDHLCRDAGITIAFPQRDVHLDSLGPLEVRIVSPEEVEEVAEAEQAPPVIP